MKSAVQRGISLLDEKVPGWQDLVDVDLLAQWAENLSVLGQIGKKIAGQEINGSILVPADWYHTPKTPMLWMLESLGVSGDAAFEYGYDCLRQDAATCTKEWRNAILALID